MVEIKKILETEKVAIGTDQTIKNLKLDNVKSVFVSSNCPEQVRTDINTYAEINKVEINELTESNEELGVLAKKPFNISVLSVLKM